MSYCYDNSFEDFMENDRKAMENDRKMEF